MTSLARYLFVGLSLLLFPSWAATVDTLSIVSKGMQRTMQAAVILPQGYQKSKLVYPVVYLLHGGRGLFTDWFTKPEDKRILHRLADQYQVLIVTPQCESRGYYLDSPLLKDQQSETYVSQELIQAIDKGYRTIPNRKGRVITGMSMGGHGALYLATRHPDLYCAAGSMSGVMDLNTDTWNAPAETLEDVNANFSRLLGPRATNIALYQSHSLVQMTERIKDNDVQLIIDCGTDDLLLETNREMHRRLIYRKAAHDYCERPGGHTWEYWKNSLPYHFLFFQKVWRANGCLLFPEKDTSEK